MTSAQMPQLIQREIINKIFNQLDIDGNGFLDEEELGAALKKLNLPLNKEDREWKNLVQGAKGGAVSITRENFITHVINKQNQLRELFDELDEDGNGNINFDEFCRGWRRIHPKLDISEPSMRTIFDGIDENKNGQIEFEEWLKLLCLVQEISMDELFNIWETWIYSTIEDVPLPTNKYSSNLKWVLSSLAAGGIAGAVSKTTTAPLDRIKVLLQVQSNLIGKDMSFWSKIYSVYQEGGIISFWRGNFTNVVKIVPESALIFTLFDLFQKNFSKDPKKPAIHESLSIRYT